MSKRSTGFACILLFFVAVGSAIAQRREPPDEERQKDLERLGHALDSSIRLEGNLTGVCCKVKREPSEREQRTLEAIQEQRFQLEKREWTVMEILKRLSRRINAEVHLSAKMSKAGLSEKSLGVQEIGKLSFDQILRWLSQELEMDLSWQLAGGAVSIVSGRELDARREIIRTSLDGCPGASAEIVGSDYILVRITASTQDAKARELRDKLNRCTYTAEWQGTSLDLVAENLELAFECECELSSNVQKLAVDEGLLVNWLGREVNALAALDQMLDSTGARLRWRIQDGGIHILTEGEMKAGAGPATFYLLDIRDLLKFSSE